MRVEHPQRVRSLRAGGDLHRAGRMTALAFLVWASAASAQEAIDRSWTAASGSQGYTLSPGVAPALRGFDVGYTRSDHQVRHLLLGPVTSPSPLDSGDFVISLRDAAGDDAVSGSVKLTDVRRLGRHLEVSRRDCSRECRLLIPNLISSEAFLLTGFAFGLISLGDRNVLQVKVRQAAHNGYIDVAFVDRAGTEPYFAHVTYAVIPRALLGPYLVQARSTGPVRGQATVPRPPGLALLQSFDLRFLNGDHHLQRIAVDLTGDRILVRFRDQNGDDPFEWAVEYSVLR